jgi:hypothetical protein
MRSKAHTALTSFWFYILQQFKCAMKKFGINGQLRNKLFLMVIHPFSLVKAAMISARVCKLSKNCHTCIDQCKMVFKKTPPFPNFPIARGRTKTIAHSLIAEGLSFRSLHRCIYDCKLRIEKNIYPSTQ